MHQTKDTSGITLADRLVVILSEGMDNVSHL